VTPCEKRANPQKKRSSRITHRQEAPRTRNPRTLWADLAAKCN
jgi:hypothetical protein